ncbi:hypothetical protein COU17_00635 [Candidatus Kaiserbacteria bacterium CG10_big_fil_rev_8_21_14_0_10_49_17]|uniref:Uncharacterized protein n=1 Tax=Candidatus Kaiserbacteria bacterium CG10_big_fil_rev_8_21_14_0_10_49_17 TaxID=1974609 RepID=A0A2M6WFC3_9BACT|nr:MAG: hypothetical protein COU17_00635 [Candidatus Kaiserbacteria bacterium CG10_big_fil_rev_8_21_14_0_10_49_17]
MKFFITALVLFALVGVAVAGYFYFLTPVEPNFVDIDADGQPLLFPDSSGSNGIVGSGGEYEAIQGQNGVVAIRADAIQESTVAVGTTTTAIGAEFGYPLSDDQKFVAGGFDKDFLIYFNRPQSTFYIYLQSEPLKEARELAESTFLSTLGIAEESVCELYVWVFVDENTNEFLAGNNFGLSFCPGAEIIP